MKIKLIFLIIIIVATGLRFYKLDQFPPSISWDEAAVGYNAFSIANYGKDEYGEVFPLFFKSFGDDKHPVHIYLTAVSVKLFGLSEFSIRLPVALFGVMNVIIIFFLAKFLFKSEIIGLIASFLLAISPFNLHFSRFNHEANFLLFFFLIGLTLFIYSVKKNNRLLPLSTFGFGISFLAYHPAKVVVPVIVGILILLFWRQIIENKKALMASVLISSIFLVAVLFNPQLLGLARIKQNTLSKDKIESTYLFKITKNETLGKLNLVSEQYVSHFSPTFLFLSGDKNPRLSSQSNGEIYLIELPFFVLGIIFLLLRRSKEGLVLLAWIIAAPLPSSLVAEAPHAARASLMMGALQITTALGFYQFIIFLKRSLIKRVIVSISLFIVLGSVIGYLKYYYGEYTKRYAIEWQYGYKQAVEYVKQHEEYHSVYVTDVRSQPYVFFLFYLQTPLDSFRSSALFNNQASKSYNTISSYGKYYFGGWNPSSDPYQKGVLYILTPSEYDGLMNRDIYDVKKVIKYPNGTTAFYLVAVNN